MFATHLKRAFLTALAICSAAACSATPTEPGRDTAGAAVLKSEAPPPPSDTTAAARGIGMFGSGN